jgi:hypothetical protein
LPKLKPQALLVEAVLRHFLVAGRITKRSS